MLSSLDRIWGEKSRWMQTLPSSNNTVSFQFSKHKEVQKEYSLKLTIWKSPIKKKKEDKIKLYPEGKTDVCGGKKKSCRSSNTSNSECIYGKQCINVFNFPLWNSEFGNLLCQCSFSGLKKDLGLTGKWWMFPVCTSPVNALANNRVEQDL